MERRGAAARAGARAMRRPGDRLRAVAARVCRGDVMERLTVDDGEVKSSLKGSRYTAARLFRGDVMERVIDPLIADLQFEDADAIRTGRRRRRLRVRLAAYVAFWQALALCAATGSTNVLRAWAAADDFAVGRTIAYPAVIIAILTGLLALMPFHAVVRRAQVDALPTLFLYGIPQAIPVAVDFGLPIGILIGLRRRHVTARIGWSVVVLAAITAAMTFVVCAWILPEANQTFRRLVFSRVLGRPGFPMRGANELMFGELSSRIAQLTAHGRTVEAQPFQFSYHSRLAASAAPLIWGMFALGLATVAKRTWLSVLACVVAATMYIGFAGVVLAAPRVTYPWLPLPLAIWVPNVLAAALTIALWVKAPRSATH
jgi:lipopolysaccharide export system permease LptF/LptG-like protein